ncbi:MAG: Alpha-amylase 1 [Promethearchaeota archaeon]|nr:MAG: Alpha-amylase 1 [Candidatus Lokiarchaeota archaeon]
MTKKSIYFPLVFHFHQPVGNFEHVIEDSYKKAYQPLVEALYNHSEIQATLHFSGNILEWFIDKKPQLTEKIKKMSSRGQIEIIGGGYYEPIYAVIPHRDKIAQIRKLTALIQKEFGLKVKGAWLSERVWEPNYPSFLNEAELKYVIIDDNHFRSTGISQEQTLYTYVTEDDSYIIRIFPINERLRYLTPWKPTTHTINYLEEIATEEGDRIAVLISDAEKMGVWGSTHEICYIEGLGHTEGDNGRPFIPSLFERIIENKWIKSITLSEYMEEHPAKGLVYLPTSSYDKMEEWVLPTSIRRTFEQYRDRLREDQHNQELYMFLKGGFWRYYLVKYPESNNMHKKMLYVRSKLIGIEKKADTLKDQDLKNKIESKIMDAWDEIYKAQCNDPYWHGLFGGVYLQFLRFEIYTHLITAEKIIDELEKMITRNPKSLMKIIPIDLTKDSKLDLIIESNIYNLYISPSEGGTIFELDFKPKSYNLLNTLTRWEEAYHSIEKIDKNEILVDKYRRSMLRIRFFDRNTSSEDLCTDKYRELSNFVNAQFKIVKNIKKEHTSIIKLQTQGTIQLEKVETSLKCVLNKQITIENQDIIIKIFGSVDSSKLNDAELDEALESIRMGVDIPFFFNGDPNEFEELLNISDYTGDEFKALDKTYNLSFEVKILSELKDKMVSFPIISYTYTDEGYKDLYQGINLVPTFKIKKEFNIKFKLEVN